jgi:Putative MetA-pathway of phenol degradation
MRRLAVIGLIGTILLSAGAQAGSLRDQLGQSQRKVGLQAGQEFDALALSIADTAARSLPRVSASAGFTYRYNPTIEAFERTSDTLGPIFLERPDTLGKGKFNVNVSYQYVQFDAFDGDDLGRLEGRNPVVVSLASGGQAVGAEATRLRYRIGIQSHVAALSLTYGILDDFDVNLLVPVISTSLRVGVRSQQVATADDVGGPFTSDPGPAQNGSTRGHAFGVGDVLVRAKYQLPRCENIRSAIGLQLRLPTGSTADFHGTGAVELSPFFYASTRLFGRVEPHINLGIDYNAENVAQSAARYAVGVDVDAHPRVGLSLGFLGRSELDGQSSATRFQHLQANGSVQRESLLGLDFSRKDAFDLSFGARVVVWRNLMMFANGIYALNDAGLRNSTIIPSVGLEGTF